MRILSKSLEDTEKIAESFLEKASMNFYEDEATIVGLYGDLGSGKTTFTKSIAKFLGITEDITSPTFVIEKIYPIRNNETSSISNGTSDIEHTNFKKLIHIDAYRLENPKELLMLEWEHIAIDPHNLILIEWPEKVREILPENHLKVFFKFISETEREIEI